MHVATSTQARPRSTCGLVYDGGPPLPLPTTQPHLQRRCPPQPFRGLVCGDGPRSSRPPSTLPFAPRRPHTQRHAPAHCLCGRVHLSRPRRRRSPRRYPVALCAPTIPAHPFPLGLCAQWHPPRPPARPPEATCSAAVPWSVFSGSPCASHPLAASSAATSPAGCARAVTSTFAAVAWPRPRRRTPLPPLTLSRLRTQRNPPRPSRSPHGCPARPRPRGRRPAAVGSRVGSSHAGEGDERRLRARVARRARGDLVTNQMHESSTVRETCLSCVQWRTPRSPAPSRPAASTATTPPTAVHAGTST